MNNTVYYDAEVLRRINAVGLPLFWRYRSNWRVLHVDGFENCRHLPFNTGKVINLFSYERRAS